MTDDIMISDLGFLISDLFDPIENKYFRLHH